VVEEPQLRIGSMHWDRSVAVSLVLNSMYLACDLLHLHLQSEGSRMLGGDGRGDGCKLVRR
jgi:hypothetical protein